jgi:membrane protease YdiL (CAAX protease family)
MPTKLTPKEIAQACRDAFQKTSFVDKTIRFFYALYLIGIILGAAAICKFFFLSNFSIDDTVQANVLFKSDLFFFAALIFFSVLILVAVSRAGWWRFGIRIPVGKDWWLLLPIVVLAAFAKGVYIPQGLFPMHGFDETLISLILIIPLASELLFRSLVHGILTKGATIQNCRSEWFFSYPTVVSAILYAAFIAYLALLPNILQGTFQMEVMVKCLIAACAFGMAAGFVRERSQSVLPAILFHWVAITAFIFF